MQSCMLGVYMTNNKVISLLFFHLCPPQMNSIDPSNQEVISHGDTLLIDTNPRLRLAFQEDTRTSTLIVKSYFNNKMAFK